MIVDIPEVRQQPKAKWGVAHYLLNRRPEVRWLGFFRFEFGAVDGIPPPIVRARLLTVQYGGPADGPHRLTKRGIIDHVRKCISLANAHMARRDA